MRSMQPFQLSTGLVILFTSMLHVACSRKAPPAAPNVSSAVPLNPPSVAGAIAEPAPAASDARAATRHRCKNDEDCLLSCTHGAVNADWYKQALPDGDPCEDGCASKGLTASCTEQRCTARQHGVLVPECTGLMKPVQARPTPSTR